MKIMIDADYTQNSNIVLVKNEKQGDKLNYNMWVVLLFKSIINGCVLNVVRCA